MPRWPDRVAEAVALNFKVGRTLRPLTELERKVVAGDQDLRPFELAREMLLAQYNLSRLIDRIEEAGYAERRACADDGRGQVIMITAAGREMRRRMWGVYGPAIQRAMGEHLSAKELEGLDALLGTLIENLTPE